MKHAIYHNLIIKAPIEKVYHFITSPKHLENWWPLKCSGEPKQNTIYNFYFMPQYNWFGKVSKIVENKTFYIQMTDCYEGWEDTAFGFDLEDVDNGVIVKFHHVGWKECNHHFRRSSYCWAILLNSLKNYIENGVIIPFEERE